MALSSKKLDFHCYSHHIEPYIYLFSINISISLPSYVNPWCNATLVYYRQFYTCPSKSHQLPPDQMKHTTHSSIKSIFLHLIRDLICPAPQASLWALLLDVVALSPLLSSIPHFTSVSLLPQAPLFCCLRHLRRGESSLTCSRPVPSRSVLADPKLSFPLPGSNTRSGGTSVPFAGRVMPVFAHVTKRAKANERLGKIKRRRAEVRQRRG